MKIVIDIPKEDYEKIIKITNAWRYTGTTIVGSAYHAIAKGTILPKGYGDLIDREVAKEKMREAMCGTGYQHIPLSVLNSEFLTSTVIADR